ncbi:MAG TPA: aminotransferase class V-fold PLP-dependent enzyme [Pirellulales bacterium]|nr:aminotransferase class V-fold PLP-dependent enzyme [Pirellulales bacterium]
MAGELPIDDDSAWSAIAANWRIRGDTIYLNHGSYGPPPDVVRAARRRWIDRLDENPVDSFNRHYERELFAARDRLARFVGTSGDNLIFVENATAGMNVVASSFRLAAGDEVLATDHEYGAVLRIFDRACREAGATLRIVELPLPFASAKETVSAIFAAATSQTRLLIASHITSSTAVTLPIEQICLEARRRGIATAIDGPHALAQLPLAIDALGCDFYSASCHKWLSAPFGSGFLYVAPQQHRNIRPPELSWGRIQPTRVERWSDEFVWTGTRDPSAYLTIPAAIDFLEEVGLDNFRARTHRLAQYARRRLVELTGLEPIVPDDRAWYGAMAHVPLPLRRKSAADDAAARAAIGHPVAHLLQHALWRDFGVEVPIVEFGGRRYIRVSCHLYNDTRQIDRLIEGLERLLKAGE